MGEELPVMINVSYESFYCMINLRGKTGMGVNDLWMQKFLEYTRISPETCVSQFGMKNIC